MPEKIIFMTNSIAENYLTALKRTLKTNRPSGTIPRGRFATIEDYTASNGGAMPSFVSSDVIILSKLRAIISDR